jgi:hypothetical protein
MAHTALLRIRIGTRHIIDIDPTQYQVGSNSVGHHLTHMEIEGIHESNVRW